MTVIDLVRCQRYNFGLVNSVIGLRRWHALRVLPKGVVSSRRLYHALREYPQGVPPNHVCQPETLVLTTHQVASVLSDRSTQ